MSSLRQVPKPGYGLAPRSHTFSSATTTGSAHIGAPVSFLCVCLFVFSDKTVVLQLADILLHAFNKLFLTLRIFFFNFVLIRPYRIITANTQPIIRLEEI